MSNNPTARHVAEQAIADRLRPFITSDEQRDIAARHAVTALLDHPDALRGLLADAGEIAGTALRARRR